MAEWKRPLIEKADIEKPNKTEFCSTIWCIPELGAVKDRLGLEIGPRSAPRPTVALRQSEIFELLVFVHRETIASLFRKFRYFAGREIGSVFGRRKSAPGCVTITTGEATGDMAGQQYWSGCSELPTLFEPARDTPSPSLPGAWSKMRVGHKVAVDLIWRGAFGNTWLQIPGPLRRW